ncbi:MAG: protein kinase [Planctomycetota bacterium]
MSAHSLREIDQLCEQFATKIRDGRNPSLTDFLQRVAPDKQEQLLTRLLPMQVQEALDRGEILNPQDFQQFGTTAVQIAKAALQGVSPVKPSQDKTQAGLSPAYASAKTVSTKKRRREDSTHGFEVDPESLGNYKLLRQIGRGGMGTVWEAHQVYPVERSVAVKLIRGDLDAADAIARFEMERQAISKMDHPNIARILDAGTADDDRPYFVMELVQGKQIDLFCDEKKLSVRERIELMVPVCKALQHAHQKGIIHRDLKPSNVLVAEIDGEFVPKVIDFGVAKALQKKRQRFDEDESLTQWGQVVGTIQYMSPEQAQGRDVDTRTDIYGLGALIYRLLTDSLPISEQVLKSGSAVTVAESLRTHDAPRPSSRFVERSQVVERICRDRSTSVEKIRQELKGDLDWIVCKAVERDRNHRYETAQGLALDLERYLSFEEVTARPPSALYRIRKFVRRNQLAVTSIVATIFLLVAGIIGTSYGLSQAIDARRQAEENAQKAVEEKEKFRLEESKSRKLQELAEMRLHAERTKSAWANWQLGNVDSAWQQLRASANTPAWEGRFLQAEFNTTHKFLYGHANHVVSVDTSGDGKFIATCSSDQTVKIWDARTYKILANIEIGGSISQLCFDSGSSQIAVVDLSNRLSVITDWENEARTQTSEPFERDLVSVCFLNATAGSDQTSRILVGGSEFNSSKPALQWESTPVGEPPLRVVRFNPDATGSFEVEQELLGHSGSIQGISVSSDGKGLASVDAAGKLIGWDVQLDGVCSKRFELDLGFKLYDVLKLPSTTKMLVCGEDLAIRMIDESTGGIKRTYAGHDASVLALSLHPDGDKFVSASDDKTARVWDLDGNELLMCQGHFNEVKDVSFSRNGKYVVTASSDATAAIWSLESKSGAKSVRAFEALAWSADFSADGSRIVAVSEDHQIQLRSGRDLELLQQVKTKEPILCTEFSPREDLVVHAGVDGYVTVRNGKDLELLTTFEAHEGYIWDIAFSRDGKKLVTVGGDKKAKLWETDDWEQLTELDGHEAELSTGAFTFDGKQVLTGSNDATVRLWDVETGEQLHIFTGHQNIIWKVAIAKNGKFVSSSFDGELRIWDLESRRQERLIKAHHDQIAGLCIHPDCTRIVTASDDKTIRIWDLDSGLEVFDLRDASDAPVVHASFSRDGRKLITGDSHGWLTLRSATKGNNAVERYLPTEAIAFGISNLASAVEPETTLEELANVHREALKCSSFFPGYQVLTIQGVTEHRLGKHDKAIVTLTEAARLEPIEYGEPDVLPYIEAFLCLSQAELGHWPEAEAQRDVFRRKANNKAIQFDPELKRLSALIQEAFDTRPGVETP